MKARIISGVLGSFLLVVAIAFNKLFPILINIIIALAALTCVVEILAARGLLKNLKISVPAMAFAGLFPILISTVYWPVLFVLFILSLFVMLVFFYQEISIADIAFTFTTALLITAGLSSIVMLCDQDRSHTGFNITMSLIIPWMADAGAYFIGSFFGRHKLCPKISPKKTVEGALGGILFGILGAVIDALVFQVWLFPGSEQIYYINLVIIAFLCAVVSIIGDLSFSLIKRSCHVKDYGSVIPGHGGILDRCDSIIFAAPLLLVYVQYFPIMVM